MSLLLDNYWGRLGNFFVPTSGHTGCCKRAKIISSPSLLVARVAGGQARHSAVVDDRLTRLKELLVVLIDQQLVSDRFPARTGSVSGRIAWPRWGERPWISVDSDGLSVHRRRWRWRHVFVVAGVVVEVWTVLLGREIQHIVLDTDKCKLPQYCLITDLGCKIWDVTCVAE